MDDTPARKPGRAYAADIARRRIEAEAYLDRHFPTSASWWARLRNGTMSASDLANAVTAMITEAKAVQAPALVGDQDKLTLNPEQAVACVLQRVRDRDVAIARCRAELSALDAARDAISQVLAAHESAGKSDIADMIAAAAQRPSIDREIERRAIDILRAGATRADVIRLKQNADKLWARPHNWAGLSDKSGRFQIRELPPSDGIEREALPPSANILHYCRDAAAFKAMVSVAAPNTIMDEVEAELADWITLHYPGATTRKPAVMAKAWAALMMLDHRAMQESDRRISVSLPSAWNPGLVMRIESVDQHHRR